MAVGTTHTRHLKCHVCICSLLAEIRSDQLSHLWRHVNSAFVSDPPVQIEPSHIGFAQSSTTFSTSLFAFSAGSSKLPAASVWTGQPLLGFVGVLPWQQNHCTHSQRTRLRSHLGTLLPQQRGAGFDHLQPCPGQVPHGRTHI